MIDDEKINKIYKKVNNILMDISNSDIDRYNKLRKVRGSNGEYYSKEKVLKIIETWLLDNANYIEENNINNTHNWKLEYEERYYKLCNTINNKKN